MLEHNELFREYLNTYGRQLNVVVEDHAGKTYSNNEVVSVTKTFKTDLCKSTMQQLNIEIEGDVLLDETVNVKLGVSLQGTDIEQINFGDFIITDREFVVDTESTKFTAYDNMYKAHVDYDPNAFAFPCTVYEFVRNICDLLEIPFEQEEFNNSDKVIESNVFLNSALTYRDVFDMLAQVTGLNVLISKNKLVFREYKNTGITIDEVVLKTLTLKEQYGPINSLVFSRSAESDNIYRNDESSVVENGLCDIKFSDNLILDALNRNDYIDNTFNALNDLKYKIYDLEGFGCCVFEPGDLFNLKDLKGDVYQTIAFNSTITINSGITEKMYLDLPTVSQTDYASATKDERKDLNTRLQVNKELGEIKSYVEETTQSIYKFETGSGNIFDNCRYTLEKNANELQRKVYSNILLGINKAELKGKDICISCYIKVENAIVGQLSNRIGIEFDVGYADGTKKTYSVYWYLGQFDLQYLLQTSTADHEERIWAHFKLDDKEISSVSNLKMIIDLNAERAVVANPKVEFGTRPTGFDFDLGYVRDNITTIEENYTQINQTVNDLSLKAVSQEKEITTIKGNVSEVTTRIQSAEIKLQPTNILLAVNEQIGANGQLYTTKFVLDKSGVHISGGGLDIVNNSGTKVFYADANGNLIINNLKAVNGSFSGSITASVITGSTFSITSSDGCTLSIDSNGLVLNAKTTSNIFGYQGGILTIGTKKSILDSMFSPITYQEGNSSGKLWTIPLADNVSKIEFGTVMDHRIYFTTLFGRFYVECQSG
ncbi:hypothetical protein DWZ66_08095 [Coprobacillus sp. AF34-1BH]|nr:hypothetical protein DWZ66_08095 [Coprobacillus sp. AF34-1BH]